MSIAENIQNVNERINQACAKSNRNPEDIKVIAVTKYVDLEKTKEILTFGLKQIGENRAEQGIHKYEAIRDDVVWHFIGNLQTRKAKEIIGKFEYIHSVDRLSLAMEIDKRAKQQNIKVKCFVQVNVSGEESKSGVEPEELIQFIKTITEYDSIEVIGLMTMAPHYDDPELTRPIFRRLKELLDTINENKVLSYQLTELSMGMSNDFEVAIEEGATFIRLGSVLLNN